jgi:predicted transposase YbfD/YdcC
MDYINIGSEQEINENGMVFDVGSLYGYLEKLSDRRLKQGKRYRLATLVLLILLAKLGGEDNPSGIADWVAYRKEEIKKLINFPREETPCHMTFRRVLQFVIIPWELEEVMSEFHQYRLVDSKEILLSMDGKTVRGTIPAGEIKGTHLLAIYVPQQGLVLVEAEVDHKENEIVIAPQIVEKVNLTVAIIIGDAMHTQRGISSQIVEAGGDFIWTVKDNQPRTRWAIEKIFSPQMCSLRDGATLSADFQAAAVVHKGHGRLEKRTLFRTPLLNEYLDWPYVAQVFRLERIVWFDHGQRSTRQITYGLTSLPPEKVSPKKLLSLLRQYWGIENGLHYRRDVTLNEDRTRLTVGKAGHNMAILNNLIIGLCSFNGFSNLAKARRLFSAQPAQALNLIISA